MELDGAARLIAPAVMPPGGTWADLGAGSGTFTRALAQLLGANGRVIAVERDAGSLRALERLTNAAREGEAAIDVVRADLAALPALPPLDGVLIANALHFIDERAQERVLRDIVSRVRPGGRLTLVEYENRAASRWVPFPVTFERFASLARAIGVDPPTRVGDRRSAYGGSMHAAFAMTGAAGG